MKKYLVTCFLTCLGWLGLLAQQPAYFMLGEEQFEGVQIYNIIQDQQSNYWFATDEGIFKHDGYDYTRIDCPDLVGRSVFGFVINSSGTIYCHTLNHQILQIKDDRCEVIYELAESERSSDIHLYVTPEDELLVLGCKALIIDTTGQVQRSPLPGKHYFGQPFLTQDGRIIAHLSSQDSLLEVHKGKFEYVPLTLKSPLSEVLVTFFRVNGETYAIDIRTRTLYTFDETRHALSPLPSKSFLPPSEPLRFYPANDKLWIATSSSGMMLLSQPRTQQMAELMYPQYFISYVYEDREGNMLLSTFDHGVIVIPDMQIPDVMAMPDGQKVMGLSRDSDLGMLFGTDRGQLLSLQGNVFSQHSDVGTKPLESIFAWEGCPLIIFDDGRIKAYHKPTNRIQVIASGSLKDATYDGRNAFYLALNIGLVRINWDGNHDFKVQIIDSLQMRTYTVEIDRASQMVYIATADGLKMRDSTGKLQTITWEGSRIFATDLVSHNGKIYIATRSQGLLILDPDGQIRQFNLRIAGQATEISKLEFVGDRAYATTTAGFVVIGRDGQIETLLNKANGFSSNKIRNFAWDQKHLYLLHPRGLQMLQGAQLVNNDFLPKVAINSVSVNDVPVLNLLEHGRFDHTQRKIRFRLSSPTLRHRENIVYRYKLTGYENTWSTASYHDNLVVYNALAPGDYNFQVLAENHGNVSAISSYAFTISAPLYARPWFIALAVLVVAAGTVLIYQRQLAIQRRRTRILNELNLSKLIAIQSQMNPHFIFNALNSIQDLVLKGDVENSYSYITKFSNLVRSTLQFSERDLIDFEHEIKLLEVYLSLEKLRFKKELEYEIDVDEIDSDLQIPPLLIQPFVENALIHGLLHVEGPKRLTITFELEERPEGEVLLCVVTDNGIGRAQARVIRERQRLEHESFSGKAIRNRFEILSDVYQGQFGYHYEDLMHENRPAGTRVTLQIPIRRRF